MFKKKGGKKAKPQELLQPDYVKKAKKKLAVQKSKGPTLSEEEMNKMKDFWKKRNPKVKFVGDNNG